MSKKQKKMLIRIIVALVVFIACEIAEKLIHLNGVWDTVVKAAMFAVPYLMAGYDVLLKAIKNISKGHVFDENFLMAVATVGAIIIALVMVLRLPKSKKYKNRRNIYTFFKFLL